MGKKPSAPTERPLIRARVSLSARLENVRHANTLSARRTIPVQYVANALLDAGYRSLDKQAKALGVNRSTAWTIIRTKHKLGYLNAKTAKRILANPELPECIRDVLTRYAEGSVPGSRSKRGITQPTE